MNNHEFYAKTSVFDIAEFCRKNNACVDFRDNLDNGFNFVIVNEPKEPASDDSSAKHLGTKVSIDSLDPKYRTFLEDRKAVLQRTSKKDDVIGEIRGFLAALRIAGIISDLDFRLLLSYYRN